jgi:hypothetical protein
LDLVFIRQVADDNIGASALGDNVVSDFLGLGLVSSVDGDNRASRASPRATPSPMPLLLPVTSATLPSSLKSIT